jgi:hypothetical protein
MNQRTVVLAEPRMDAALMQVAREACLRAGTACHPWNAGVRLDGLAGRAALAIGVLPAGARQIPGDLAGLITDQIPGLPLLLLAEEALVRPIVSLQDGLVTLMEPPASAARLTSCVRALLAGSPPPVAEQAGWWPAVAQWRRSAPIERREYRVGSCWIGVLESQGAPDPAAMAPVAWLRTAPGISAIITASKERPSSSGADLGGAAAVVQLEITGDRSDWLFLAPPAAAAVGLFSSQRLPAFTDFGRSSAQGEIGYRRLAAAAGDIAVALAPANAWSDLAALGAELGEGGAAFLDRLEAQVRRVPVAASCLVIELR